MSTPALPETRFDLTTADGEMPTFVVHPEPGGDAGDGPWPVILFLMDAPGMREELRDMCRRIAADGYYVMTSQLYYRDVREYNVFETEDRDRMFELMSNLSNAMATDDAKALLGHADADANADTTRVGTVGYCMSGPMALMIAAALPGQVTAAASIHGVALAVDAADSPHRHLGSIDGEVYVACAETDSYAPPEMVAEFEAALAAAGTAGQVEWFPGTEHGFAFAERPAYVPEASELHWTRLFDLFARRVTS